MNTSAGNHDAAADRAPRGPGVVRILALAAPVFVLLIARAITRQSDPDEHQFVAPAMLLNTEGLLPYRDYPLFHMPGLVWVYAPLLRLSDNALLMTRAFSALVGTISAAMLFAAAWRWLGSGREGATARVRTWFSLGIVGLFLSARVFTYTNGWSWNHDASICTLLAAVLLHLHAVRTGRLWLFLFVGALLGASMSIRLTTAPAVGALGLCGLLLPSALSWGKRIAAGVAAAAGWAIVMLPTFLLYRISPDEFIFGNLGYPAVYKSYVLARGARQIGVFGKIGHFFQTWCTDPGNIAVLLLLVLAAVRIVRGGGWRGLAGARIATLGVLCAALWFGVTAPFQIQMQYHSVLLPFFLLLIACAAGRDAGLPAFARDWGRPMIWACMLAVGVNFPRWYWPIVLLPRPSEWTPMRTMAASRWVRQTAGHNARVLTIDPIVALQAGLRVYPEFATGRFTFHVGPFMTPADRERHHIAWGPQLEALVRKTPPDAVLYSTQFEGVAAPLADVARARGFLRQTSPDGEYVLWIPKAGPSATPTSRQP